MGIPLLVSMIQSDRERLQPLSTERREVASDDDKIRITVPGTWTKLPELHKFASANPSSGGQASLQVGNKSKEVYLIVVTGAKTDLDNFTLEKYHQQTRDRMLKEMKNASVTQPISLTIDGHPAVQDELTRTEKGANVVFFTPPRTTAIISTNPRVDTEITVAKPRTLSGLREVTASFRSEK
jgi:hypothetical protein